MVSLLLDLRICTLQLEENILDKYDNYSYEVSKSGFWTLEGWRNFIARDFQLFFSPDQNLQDENDVLKCQVEAYKNEINIAKQESLNSLEMKDKQIKAFQLALQGMQQVSAG